MRAAAFINEVWQAPCIQLRLVATFSFIVLAAELLIMLLPSLYLKGYLSEAGLILLDSTLFIAVVLPALHILILQPMKKQQAELKRQLDELYRFQKVTVGRELRMKELLEENIDLRKQMGAIKSEEW